MDQVRCQSKWKTTALDHPKWQRMTPKQTSKIEQKIVEIEKAFLVWKWTRTTTRVDHVSRRKKSEQRRRTFEMCVLITIFLQENLFSPFFSLPPSSLSLNPIYSLPHVLFFCFCWYDVRTPRTTSTLSYYLRIAPLYCLLRHISYRFLEWIKWDRPSEKSIFIGNTLSSILSSYTSNHFWFGEMYFVFDKVSSCCCCCCHPLLFLFFSTNKAGAFWIQETWLGLDLVPSNC